MAKKVTVTEETPDVEIPQTVNINGEEYSLEDAQNYIQKGKQTSELEKQWNTSVDKVWPEYGKLTQEQKDWQTEKEQYETKLKEFEVKKDAGVETPADVTQAKEAARKLGIVLQEDFEKAGYIKKDELPALFQTYSQEQAAVKQILDTADGLEKEIDGSDGRPEFNKKAVLAYASAYNIPDLKAAYEDMNKTRLDAWKTTQVTSQKNKGLKTFGSNGAKEEPKNVKLTPDNFSDALSEALSGE